ncbi:MAG: hypothetical protein H5T97_10965, partial [Firmicutes bacterium]|nr:hypothetical protein [Bacillota bacterium]
VELALEAGIRRGTLKSLGQTLREIRNASLVGHNMRPISSEESLLAVEVGRHLLLALGGEAVGRLVDEYPLAPARLEEVLEAVRRA